MSPLNLLDNLLNSSNLPRPNNTCPVNDSNGTVRLSAIFHVSSDRIKSSASCNFISADTSDFFGPHLMNG